MSTIGGASASHNTPERQIDVTRSNYSVIDNEFDSMRERFESEMHRVEDEMQRLRREFEGYRPVNGGTTFNQSRPYSSASSNDRHFSEFILKKKQRKIVNKFIL